MKITNTAECEKCAFSKTDEKSKNKVVCTKNNKSYYIGQHLECEACEARKSE